MSKSSIIIFLVIIFGVIVAFTFRPKGEPASLKTISTVETLAPTETPDITSRYLVFDKNTLEQFSDKRRVLFFYASWCPTCVPADASFKTNSNKLLEDVRVIRVNYNDPDTDQEEKDLAKKYGITYQHTFVQIDKDGKVVAKWNGGQIDELLKNIK